MDLIERLATKSSAIALQLTGLAYKVKMHGKVTDDQLKMLNDLTDNMTVIKKECASIETNSVQKNVRFENLGKDNAVCKRKLAEAKLEVEQLSDQCKKIKKKGA